MCTLSLSFSIQEPWDLKADVRQHDMLGYYNIMTLDYNILILQYQDLNISCN